MLKIRLQRIGRKNEPAFRLITVESRRGPKSGKNIEILGSYDPRRNRAEIKGERVLYWVSKGAKVSDTAHNLLIREKVITGKKIDVSAKAKKKEGQAEAAETPGGSPAETETQSGPPEEKEVREIETKDGETEKKEQEAKQESKNGLSPDNASKEAKEGTKAEIKEVEVSAAGDEKSEEKKQERKA